MRESEFDVLARAARDDAVSDEMLGAALARLAKTLAKLANALQVEYIGPGVGVEGHADVYRLAVRAHRLSVAPEAAWGAMICDAAPAARWRAVWALPAAGRRRRLAVARALPEFFGGYVAAVRAAGRAQTEPGRALVALARACRERFGAGA